MHLDIGPLDISANFPTWPKQLLFIPRLRNCLLAKMSIGLVLRKVHSFKNTLQTLQNVGSSQFWTSLQIFNQKKMVHLLSFSLSGSHDLGPGILWVKCNMFITLSRSPTALEINGWHQPAQTWIGESTNKAGNGQTSGVGRDSKIIRWWKNRQVYGQAGKRKRQAATQTHRETRDRVTISGCNNRCSHS